MKKRPVRVTIISILLGWLALAGLANVVVGVTPSPTLAAAYGLTALLAAVGLWKMKRWAIPAYVAWTVVLIVTAFTAQKGQFRIPPSQFAAFLSVVLLIVSAGGVTAWRALKKSVEPAGGAYVAPEAGAPSAHP